MIAKQGERLLPDNWRLFVGIAIVVLGVQLFGWAMFLLGWSLRGSTMPPERPQSTETTDEGSGGIGGTSPRPIGVPRVRSTPNSKFSFPQTLHSEYVAIRPYRADTHG